MDNYPSIKLLDYGQINYLEEFNNKAFGQNVRKYLNLCFGQYYYWN